MTFHLSKSKRRDYSRVVCIQCKKKNYKSRTKRTKKTSPGIVRNRPRKSRSKFSMNLNQLKPFLYTSDRLPSQPQFSTYVHAQAYKCTHTHARTYAHTYIHRHARTHVCSYIQTHVYTALPSMFFVLN